jgi:hypothetical protein
MEAYHSETGALPSDLEELSSTTGIGVAPPTARNQVFLAPVEGWDGETRRVVAVVIPAGGRPRVFGYVVAGDPGAHYAWSRAEMREVLARDLRQGGTLQDADRWAPAEAVLGADGTQ